MDNSDTNFIHIHDGEGDDDSMEDNVPQTESQNGVTPSQKPMRSKRLSSKVWKSFTILKQEPNQPLYCKCNKCGKKYLASSNMGTGNLRRHLEKCSKSTTKNIGQYMVSTDNSVLGLRTSRFSQERFNELLIYALVRHDLPFSFVEYEGIRNIFKYLEPSVSVFSRNTAKSRVRKLHHCEIKKLRDELIMCPGRISLTSDCWTSIVTDGYISLTAHFIDSNWVLRKKVLNFSYMPPPHTGIALAEKISGLVKSWGIEKKLFSITLDNASANDVCVDVLRNQFRLMSSLVYDGQLFHLRCCNHILNLIVKDGLKHDVVVDKIRECVKHVKGSQGRKDKFSECCSQTSLSCKKALTQDVPTRWNFTYLMLSSALYYRLAFCHLSLSDSNFKCCPSMDEWERAEKICDFLQVFYEATLVFSGTLYPTSNLFFPSIFNIYMKLVSEMKSQDAYMKKTAEQMWAKFNKYWADFSLLLAVAVAFDPRYKLSFVEFSYRKIYGEGSPQYQKVNDTLFGLFNEYVQSSSTSKSNSYGASNEKNSENGTCGDVKNTSKSILEEFDLYDSASSSSSQKKCQLTEYLDEPRTKTTAPLCILDYWKAQQYRYPDVARLAMDILSVPVSTVVSESAFSLGGRLLNPYRSAMLPATVEGLVCSRDWLFNGTATTHDDIDVTQNVLDLNMDKEATEDD